MKNSNYIKTLLVTFFLATLFVVYFSSIGNSDTSQKLSLGEESREVLTVACKVVDMNIQQAYLYKRVQYLAEKHRENMSDSKKNSISRRYDETLEDANKLVAVYNKQANFYRQEDLKRYNLPIKIQSPVNHNTEIHCE